MNRKKRNVCLILVLMLILIAVKQVPPNIRVSSTVNGKELPIYEVQTDKKQVALTFDCAWGDEYTSTILEILKKQNIHITFFMTGAFVSKYPEVVKAIVADGHEIGNHSENHKNMTQLSEEEKKKELLSVHQKVKELTGVEMHLFRAPYGAYDDKSILNAKENGYFTIQWNVDSEDWKNYGKESILKKVIHHKQLDAGSIILCHNGAKYTTEVLEELIVALKEKGYSIVPVSELIYTDDYHMDVKGMQIKNN